MDEQKDLLSVIVPVYKVEQYLDRCVESIVNQTYRNIEIILVDDGSPDECPQLCDEWAKRDSRVKVIHKKNGGLSDARNAGTEAATGEFVCYIDSDDYVESDMLEALYVAIKKYSADVATCGYRETTSEVSLINDNTDFDPIVGSGGEILLRCCTDYSWMAWGRLYHRSLLVKEKFTIGILYEDYDFLPRLFSHVNKAVILPKVYYHYFIREDSIMGKTKKAKHPDILTITQRNLDFMKESDQFNGYNGKIIGRYFVRLFHGMRSQEASHLKKSCSFGRQLNLLLRGNYRTMIGADMAWKYKIALSILLINPVIFHKLFRR